MKDKGQKKAALQGIMIMLGGMSKDKLKKMKKKKKGEEDEDEEGC